MTFGFFCTLQHIGKSRSIKIGPKSVGEEGEGHACNVDFFKKIQYSPPLSSQQKKNEF